MRTLKRDFKYLSAIIAVAFLCALLWGRPFLSTVPAGRQNQAQQQPNRQPSQSSTFTGTIVRNGDAYVLRDSSGAMYGLDDPERARPFEGKAVKVAGQLDEQARVIRVENIESA